VIDILPSNVGVQLPPRLPELARLKSSEADPDPLVAFVSVTLKRMEAVATSVVDELTSETGSAAVSADASAVELLSVTREREVSVDVSVVVEFVSAPAN